MKVSGSPAPSNQKGNSQKLAGSRQNDTRMNNIFAAEAVSKVVRTSLGPRGMDKMVSRVT